MNRWSVIVVLALACAAPLSPAPSVDVSGSWLATGRIGYNSDPVCVDTLDMRLTQHSDSVRGDASWRFQCFSEPVTVGPRLIVRGRVQGSIIWLAWTTDSSHFCMLCPAFDMQGHARDSSMDGRYQDHLGGLGDWVAHRVP